MSNKRFVARHYFMLLMLAAASPAQSTTYKAIEASPTPDFMTYQPQPHDDTERFSTIASITAGLGAACGSFYALKEWLVGDRPGIIHASGGIGLLTSILTHYYIYQTSPEGIFCTTRARLVKLIQQPIITALTTSTHPLSTIDQLYVHHVHPRPKAFYDLSAYIRELNSVITAFEELIKALPYYAKLEKQKPRLELRTVAIKAVTRAKALRQQLVRIAQGIQHDPDWPEQMKAYDAHLARLAQEETAWLARQTYLNQSMHHCTCYYRHCCCY